MTPHAWHCRGQLLRVGAHEIFLVDSGEPEPYAPALFLLHGYPSSSFDWHRLLPLLEGTFRCVAIDLLGFGLSSRPFPHPYRIEEQADIVEAVAEALQIDDFHVMSHDYGNIVTQELLARDFDRVDERRVRSASFLNGSLFWNPRNAGLAQRTLSSSVGPALVRCLGHTALQAAFPERYPQRFRSRRTEMADHRRTIDANQGPHMLPLLLRSLDEQQEHRDRWLLAMIQSYSPLLVVSGSQDPVSGPRMVRRFRELVDHGDVVELTHAGRYPHLEAPRQVARALQGWMDRLYARREPEGWDALVVGAMVFDGRGSPPSVHDVALRGGRVAARGTSLSRDLATEVIEAPGLWLVPGFVDLGAQLGVTPSARVVRESMRHGCTTVATTPLTWSGARESWDALAHRGGSAHQVPLVPLSAVIESACDGKIHTRAERSVLLDEIRRALRRGYAGVYADVPLRGADRRAIAYTVAQFGRVLVTARDLESHEPTAALRQIREALLAPHREAAAAQTIHGLTGAQAHRLSIDRGTLDLDAVADLVLLDPRALLRSFVADPVREVWRAGVRVVRHGAWSRPDAGPGALLTAR